MPRLFKFFSLKYATIRVFLRCERTESRDLQHKYLDSVLMLVNTDRIKVPIVAYFTGWNWNNLFICLFFIDTTVIRANICWLIFKYKWAQYACFHTMYTFRSWDIVTRGCNYEWRTNGNFDGGLFTTKSIFPDDSFFGKKMPDVMTNNCSELRRALSEVFPTSNLLLCSFHISQQGCH